MPTSYTSLLGLALPVTGELSGTWGDTVNDYITQYLDASVAGTQTISGSQTAVTLSKTTATSLSQAGSGATGSSQYNIINCTGNPASMLTVTVPAASKTYVVVNATSTNQDVKIVGAGPTTGVTLVAGEKAVIAWNGSDFIKVATSTADGVTTLSFGSTGLTPSTATSGAVTVAGTLVAANGGTGQSSYTTGDLLYATGSTALSKLGIGTNGQILTSTGTAPQWSTLSGVAVTTFSAGTTGFTPSTATSGAVTLAGTLATTNGGTGLTSFTANRVFYASSTSAIGQSANLTFDGTTLTVNNLTDSSLTSGRVTYATTGGNLTDSANLTFDGTNLTLGGGTANGVAYLNGSKVLTTGSALVFDGTSTAQISSGSAKLRLGLDASNQYLDIYRDSPTGGSIYNAAQSGGFGFHVWQVTGTEQMRLTTTGLGIGTSSPAYKLDVSGSANITSFLRIGTTPATGGDIRLPNTGIIAGRNAANSSNRVMLQLDSSDSVLLQEGSVTINSSGNLGLGVTPQTWSAGRKAIQLGQSGALAASTNSQVLDLASNVYVDASGQFRYIATGFASFYRQIDSASQWHIAASGTAGNIATFTQAMTLDASGNLGIGATANLTAKLNFPSADSGEVINIYSNSVAAGRSGIGKYSGETRYYCGQGDIFTWVNGGPSGTERMRLDSSGNLGLGVTPFSWASGWSVYQANRDSAFGGANGGAVYSFMSTNAYATGTGSPTTATWRYNLTGSSALLYEQNGGQFRWLTAPSGTAGNAISFTQAMTLDGDGNLNIRARTNNATTSFRIQEDGGTALAEFSANEATGEIRIGGILSNYFPTFYSSNAERARITTGGQFAVVGAGTAGAPVISKSDDLDTGIFFPAANELAFAVNGVEELRITSAGFTRPVAYADTVSALGNTGTATTINLLNGNVFTATLTGNCTFTLSNPIATGSSSFTLILTNDGTAGRTVAWAGGSFVFPGGAASLSRTTTANAVDVWVFFTPNGGTTWYGNIAMKDMKA